MHHHLLEQVLRSDDARRIENDDLIIVPGQNAQDPVTRCLRFPSDDGDLLPDERVEQGGFADIRLADDGHISAAESYNFV